ncbi:MAG: M23 family metallopeptidase [Limisphaerales bacterium]
MIRFPRRITFLGAWLLAAIVSPAQSFYLPTPNRDIFKTGAETRFYAPTPGKDWVSGTYGCVRSQGLQFHEGIDILRVNTDRRGEPIDEVKAAATGTVAYVNGAAGKSNYGKYVILRHRVEGVSVYTLYAHLKSVVTGMKRGTLVKAGQTIAVMGRTANTRTAIARYRAHLHFEIALVLNDRFDRWYKTAYKGGVNEHGIWNGRNLLGLDPTAIMREQQNKGQRFSLLNYIRYRPEMFRVLVPKKDFFYARFYRPLMRRNPVAEKNGIDGYEIIFDYAGIPCQLIPRSKSEVKFSSDPTLLSVDDALAREKRCRKLLYFKNGKWGLTRSGSQMIEILTYGS